MLPKSKVHPKMVDKYMVQERDRRRKLLEKYVDACSAAKVPQISKFQALHAAIYKLINFYNNGTGQGGCYAY